MCGVHMVKLAATTDSVITSDQLASRQRRNGGTACCSPDRFPLRYTAEMTSPTKALVAAVPLTGLLIITACNAPHQPAGTTPAPAASSTTSSTASTSTQSPSSASTAKATASLPESCTATPAGAFGLTGVELTPAAGHPDGAKTVRWTTNGPIPATGTVAFTLTSGAILRGVKFDNGTVIGNYVFHTKAAKQDNITIPPGVEGNTISVFIPAADAPELGSAWSADLEVDGHSTGKCVP